ncbi:rho GTPase-activating protein 23-like protein [Lates japonicus]|uniref:Rho GTPase-activating protein 23-like protein n=1 Tax=Lates japonicus TaxID=270547 RepID=A0AAD3N2V9_LATJO|nr:rho GTPase-activating protein 23-like protein [Lates japonicus]
MADSQITVTSPSHHSSTVPPSGRQSGQQARTPDKASKEERSWWLQKLQPSLPAGHTSPLSPFFEKPNCSPTSTGAPAAEAVLQTARGGCKHDPRLPCLHQKERAQLEWRTERSSLYLHQSGEVVLQAEASFRSPGPVQALRHPTYTKHAESPGPIDTHHQGPPSPVGPGPNMGQW